MTYQDIGYMFFKFVMLSITSIAIGLAFGLGCAFVFKNLQGIDKQPVREIFLLMLFAYVSYITSEICGFSGVITLFCCGLTMSYYAYENLSPDSRIGSTLAIETLGHAAEAFVFTYLGLCTYGMEQKKFSSSFFFFVLLSCIFARAAGVFIPALLVGICRFFNLSISLK